MVMAPVKDMVLDVARNFAQDEETRALLDELHYRRKSVEPEMARFREWCDRADALYYANEFSKWGADIWPEDPHIQMDGYSHISVNSPAAYVDIPAALQATPPVENMLPTKDEDAARDAAAATERIYYSWKREEEWEEKVHRACIAKGLYGRTAARVYWEEAEGPDEKGHPCAEIIDQPRNLYLGWKNSEYDDLVWAAYVQRLSPDAVMEEFGLSVDIRRNGMGDSYPVVTMGGVDSFPGRPWLDLNGVMIEVWDYWYFRPAGRPVKGKRTKMEVWNAIFVGNVMVKNEAHPEYDGEFPIKVLMNTYLPGVPSGRPDLYDVEQLIREKQERLTQMAQMIHAATAGTYWQLTGPEAPYDVPASAKPQLNQVAAPGPGNRIEPIQPVVIQFQAESYLDRVDREMAVVTGLNDLLLGLSPSGILSSSKAINALLSNYGARLAMRLLLLYCWRKETWELVLKVWAKKDETVRDLLSSGGGVLDIKNPSLTPRDDMETAQRAINLLNAKAWSLARVMDATGVDDPQQEQDIIREEQTDATLNPAAVQVMVQLLLGLMQVQQQAPAGVQQQADQAQGRIQNDLRTALGQAVPGGTTATQAPSEQGILPPPAATPGPGGAPPFAQDLTAQTLVQGGQLKGRILSQQKLGRR